jgi:hypothetical protein
MVHRLFDGARYLRDCGEHTAINRTPLKYQPSPHGWHHMTSPRSAMSSPDSLWIVSPMSPSGKGML